jgi:cytosine/adenosine deaminase-related metal-dependent hydrolase
MTNDEFTLTARWVFPVTAAPLERGLVTVRRDSIVAVEPHGTRKADADLGNVALTPGFVNAHTHLDLTGARGLTPPTPDFVGWLRRVIAYRRGRTADKTAADIAFGIADSVRFGTTLIGDIAVEGMSWNQLAAAPMRAVVFRELIGMTAERATAAWEGFAWWLKSVEETETCRPGVSPHAPYTVAAALYQRASSADTPLAIHLAETSEELELLADHRGPFVELLREFGAWAPDRLMRSVDRPAGKSLVGLPSLLVHCNYLPVSTRIGAGSTIIYCPRTHAAFGHPPHPFREFLGRGIHVGLATDSLASNPDLSVLAEARFIRAHNPAESGVRLLRLATISGARALGWADETGSLEPNKSADFAVVGLPDREAADPHELLFDSDLPVVSTWFRGREVFNRLAASG